MQAVGFNPRVNLDGFITSSSAGSDSCDAYVQFFRSGAVESACVLWHPSGEKVLPSRAYEEDVLEFVSHYVRFAGQLEIKPPHFLFLSFVGVRGYRFGLRDPHWVRGRTQAFKDDMVVLPEVVLSEHNEQSHQVMKPAFDMVWNAFGFVGSRGMRAWLPSSAIRAIVSASRVAVSGSRESMRA